MPDIPASPGTPSPSFLASSLTLLVSNYTVIADLKSDKLLSFSFELYLEMFDHFYVIVILGGLGK